MLNTTKIFVLFVVMFFSFHVQRAQQNKIIYLISPPRSLSVAFLRMMQARGDFVIMHEPSQLAYTSLSYPNQTHEWFLDHAPQNFSQVKEKIFNQAKNNSVFVKEISFAVEDFLSQETDLMKDPRVQFVFLLRNPHHVIVSFYKKCNGMFMDDKQSFSNLIGFKATYNLYNRITAQAVHKPLIVISEDLYTNPEETVKSFCRQLGITYKPESLFWPELDNHFDGGEWQEIKKHKLMHHWHGDALKSNGFGRPHDYQLDENGQPSFAEIANIRHREICKEAYQQNNNYYNLLVKKINY